MKENKINIYCGFQRNTIVSVLPAIFGNIVFQIDCLECSGTGIFDCGIEEEKGICICCKGTGKVFIGI